MPASSGLVRFILEVRPVQLPLHSVTLVPAPESRGVAVMRWLVLVCVAGACSTVISMGASAWGTGLRPDSTPAESAAARNEADRNAARGWDLVESGKFAAAAASFTDALRLIPEEPSFLVGLGLAYHHLERDELAVPLLQRALAHDPSVGLADRILGDIYLGVEEFQRAADHYERAAYQDPNDARLRDRLLSARQAVQAEAKSSRIFSSRFVVRYPSSAQPQVAAETLAALEQAYTQVGDHLEYTPSEPLTVILYPRRQFVELTESPHWVGGLFDGRLHLALESLQGGRDRVQGAVTHEYTHAAVDALSAGRAPAWLNEGLALEFGAPGRGRLEDELDPIRADLMPLRSLHESFLTLPPAAVRVVYVESRVAAVDLIERYGLEKVRRLLRTLARDPDFARAFETVMGTPYQLYDEMWLAKRTQGRL